MNKKEEEVTIGINGILQNYFQNYGTDVFEKKKFSKSFSRQSQQKMANIVYE